MENDRELLELAAKAIGKNVIAHKFCDEFLDSWDGLIDYEDRFMSNPPEWSPLKDDGDCARMEAALGIDIEWLSYEVCAYWKDEDGMLLHEESECYSEHKGDKQAARRMASLRVAAEIGRAMQSDKR